MAQAPTSAAAAVCDPPWALRLPHRVASSDGLLRPFDVSTVLWPAGYLLSQWVSSQEQCAPREGRRRVLEVGAGATGGWGAGQAGSEA
eukprot:5223104-Pleurochrysis_carterae.AAC.1